MTNLHETNGAQTLECEVEHEAERLIALVKELRAECERLRTSLADAEAHRDLYLKALYEKMRKDLISEFENVTLEELQATSAGPVELID
jgi:hypothetical protein